ncbi:MAG: hypothetical protein J5954_06240 [Prevotella sp.]|jgi:hypothetical protein|nr:hypothetical protein [Prevotella sp.]
MSIKSIRNWLNLLFMLGAIVGLLVYFMRSREQGTYIILGSMILKFVEAGLRMIKTNE